MLPIVGAYKERGIQCGFHKGTLAICHISGGSQLVRTRLGFRLGLGLRLG